MKLFLLPFMALALVAQDKPKEPVKPKESTTAEQLTAKDQQISALTTTLQACQAQTSVAEATMQSLYQQLIAAKTQILQLQAPKK